MYKCRRPNEVSYAIFVIDELNLLFKIVQVVVTEHSESNNRLSTKRKGRGKHNYI